MQTPCERGGKRSGGGTGAYHWNPSRQRVVKFVLLPVVGLEDEFVVELGEGDARVGVKFRGVLGEAGSWCVGGERGAVSLLHVSLFV